MARTRSEGLVIVEKTTIGANAIRGRRTASRSAKANAARASVVRRVMNLTTKELRFDASRRGSVAGRTKETFSDLDESSKDVLAHRRLQARAIGWQLVATSR